MRSPLTRALAMTSLILLATPREAAAAKDPVLAVLYFDNNTSNPELDVLQKGFADMMITDLSQVDGITVVERAKLQSLLDELKLQRTRYFDDKTALKLGRGLGATHAVAGSFVAAAPNMRIDVRLIEIQTSKVVLATRVTGQSSQLFELEQKLVGDFVSKLKGRFEPPALPRTRGASLEALVTYSKGIDLADKDKLEDAREMLALAIKQAPAFGLARTRRDEISRRLEAARQRRDAALGGATAALMKHAEDFLKRDLATLDAEGAKTYLAYRILRGRMICAALSTHLSKGGPNIILRGKEGAARALLKAEYENWRLLLRELEAYAAARTQVYPNGIRYLDTSYDLPDDDERRARDAKFYDSFSMSETRARMELAGFLLQGNCDMGEERLTVAPIPADLLSARKTGYALLEDAWSDADARMRAGDRSGEHEAISALEEHAEALLLIEEREKAIAKLQEILDRYPTSSYFGRVEKRIKQELGLVYENSVSNRERYAKGLQGCDDMDLRVGLGGVQYPRARRMGLDATDSIIQEIEKACRGNPRAKHFWEYLYSHMALFAGGNGDCPKFEALMKRAHAEGLGQSSVDAYRKNYTKCPVP